MLTPAYASPEQVRGEHLGTATDIYSLGVLLYELLTGRNPHLRGQASPVEVCRTVCEDDPPPPSHATERGLRRQLAGDLDNIVLMALRKEPEGRYRSVDEFRADIEEYLAGRPVRASRGTAWYRFRKYAGRHRWGLAQTLALQQLVADADAENFGARLEVAKSLVTTGLIYRDAGRTDDAIRCLRDAAARFEAAMPHDTANQSTLFHLTWSLAEIGHTLIQRAETAGRSQAQIRADWETASVAYGRAATHLSRLSLGGKLMGIHDLQLLKEGVADGIALRRRELARAKVQNE